jgi:dihydrofolate synthase/folylpolyglutamate synthase
VVVEDDRVRVTTPAAAYPPLRPLPGAHQRQNLVVAVRLLEAAHAAGVPFDPAARPEVVARGVAATRWPGRLQRIAGRPALLLDGAHNPAGARALADHLRALGRPFVLLFGAMADKDVGAMGRELFPLAVEVVLTQAPGDRAARASEIVQRVGEAAARCHLTEGTRPGLAMARRLAGPQGLVVVAGSLYLVGEVLKARTGRPRRPRK